MKSKRGQIQLFAAGAAMMLLCGACGAPTVGPSASDTKGTGSTAAISTEEPRYTAATSDEMRRTEATTTKNPKPTETKSHTTTTSSEPPSTTATTTITIPSYPIEHLQQKISGTDLTFTVRVNQNIMASDDSVWFDVKIARSLEELQKIFEMDSNPNHINYIQDYSKDDFKDQAVIVMFITRNSGSLRHKIDSLITKDGELCIAMSTTTVDGDETGTDDMAYWRTLIDVNKDDIQDIKKISCYNAPWE